MKVKAIIIAMGLAALASTSAFAASSYEGATVGQFGNGNVADVTQTNSHNDKVNVLQNADTANATVQSDAGGYNVTDIQQNGNVKGASKLSATLTQSQAVGETTTIRQTGNNLGATISQTSSMYDTDTVKQAGKNATASITRSGSSYNTVNIDQGTGLTSGPTDGAKATVTQTNTVANTVDILQGNKSGIATVDQRNGGYNHARIEQTGGGTDGKIEQWAEVGDNASIKQSDAARSQIHSENGGYNTNTIVQSGANAPHYAQINQSYANNDKTTIIQTGPQYNEGYVDQIRSSNDTAFLIQDGDTNKAAARQNYGSGNTVVAAQVGAHNKMDLTQQAAFESTLLAGQVGGYNNITGSQSGTKEELTIAQVGDLNSANASQAGSYNTALITQVGFGNVATTAQSGVGNATVVTQGGAFNKANVVQK